MKFSLSRIIFFGFLFASIPLSFDLIGRSIDGGGDEEHHDDGGHDGGDSHHGDSGYHGKGLLPENKRPYAGIQNITSSKQFIQVINQEIQYGRKAIVIINYAYGDYDPIAGKDFIAQNVLQALC